MAGMVRSKTDIRKQARNPDKRNPPPGRHLPQSIRAQLYIIEVIITGDIPSQVH